MSLRGMGRVGAAVWSHASRVALRFVFAVVLAGIHVCRRVASGRLTLQFELRGEP